MTNDTYVVTYGAHRAIAKNGEEWLDTRWS